MNTRAVVGLLAVLAVCGSAAPAEKPHAGYLQPGTFDVLPVLPAAPVAGEVRYEADRAIFRSTRALAGTPRWTLATQDVQYGTPYMLQSFSCAVGVTLTPANAPRLVALIEKAGKDTGRQTGIAKNHYKRSRPYQIDPGKTCQPEEELKGSFDYPSGHTNWGWTWALILADLVPERASAILARGRAYGESRIVCGVHNASAVEAGFLTATATLAAVRATADYKRDRAAARAEVTGLLKRGKAPAACEGEAALVGQNIYAPSSNAGQ